MHDRMNEPMHWSFLRRFLLAGVGGAWAVSFLLHLYLSIREPGAVGDAEYMVIFCYTLPVGWLLGSIVGTVIAYLRVPPPHPALWKTIALIIGGMLASPVVALVVMPFIALTIILPVELITRLFR
jgi:hypothetical protein